MSLNSKQLKATLTTGNQGTLPQRDREAVKNDKNALGSDALVVLIVYETTWNLISLAWGSLTAEAQGPFQGSKELKMN